MLELQTVSEDPRDGVNYLATLCSGRAWAFHHSVLTQNQLPSGEYFNSTGAPFSSDAEWIRRWLTPGLAPKLPESAPRTVLLSQRSFVQFHSLTDVNEDGSPFPWLSDVPIPM